MMELVQGMVVTIAEDVFDSLIVKRYDGQEIDLTPPWRRITYREIVEERLGKDWFRLSTGGRRMHASQMGVELPGDAADYEITNAIFGETNETTLIQPALITPLPAGLGRLAQPDKQDTS